MYPSTSLFIAIGQFAIVILVLFSYPLQVLPCRNCLDKVFHDGKSLVQKPVSEGEEEEEDAEDDEFHHEMTWFKHFVLTACIVICGFTIAYFVDDLHLGESCFLPSSYRYAGKC